MNIIKASIVSMSMLLPIGFSSAADDPQLHDKVTGEQLKLPQVQKKSELPPLVRSLMGHHAIGLQKDDWNNKDLVSFLEIERERAELLMYFHEQPGGDQIIKEGLKLPTIPAQVKFLKHEKSKSILDFFKRKAVVQFYESNKIVNNNPVHPGDMDHIILRDEK